MEGTACAEGRREKRRKWWAKRLKDKQLQKCVGDLASEERGKPGCVHIGKQRVGQQALISSTTISEAGFRRSSRQNALKSPAESTKLDRTDCSPSSSEYEDSSCEEEVSDADTTKVAHAPAQCPMTGSAVGEGTPSSGRKVRYIAFIGNLPFTVTGDDIVEHFQKKGVNITEVRMLTKKGSGESRGCCFAEFRDAKSLQNALKFHHTLMAGRRLNLEVTCGGGGKGSERMKKIRDRNETLRKAQRRKSKTKNSQPQSLQ